MDNNDNKTIDTSAIIAQQIADPRFLTAIIENFTKISQLVQQNIPDEAIPTYNNELNRRVRKLREKNIPISHAVDLARRSQFGRLADALGYEGKDAGKYANIFFRKMVSSMAAKDAEMMAYLNKYTNLAKSLKSGVDLTGTLLYMSVATTLKSLFPPSRFSHSAIRGQIRNTMKFIREHPNLEYDIGKYELAGTEHPRYFLGKVVKVEGEPNKVYLGNKKIPASYYPPMRVGTTTREIATLIFDSPVPKHEYKSYVHFRTNVMKQLVWYYTGTGVATGSVRRLNTVYNVYERNKGYDRAVQEAHLGEYFDEIGIRGDEGPGNLGDPSTWLEHFAMKNWKVNPINMRAEAGPPFPNTARRDVYEFLVKRADNVFRDAGRLSDKALRAKYPELGMWFIKSKSEPNKFHSEFPNPTSEAYDEELKVWKANNRNTVKTRVIYVPASTVTLPGLILFGAVFKNMATNFFTTYDKTLNYFGKASKSPQHLPVIGLSKFPYVRGTFDLLIRRITREHPYEGREGFCLHYSDNLYVCDQVMEDYWVSEKLVVYANPTDRKLRSVKGRVNLKRQHLLVSLDGSKMETATRKTDAYNFLKALLARINASQEVINYTLRVFLDSVAGGVGVFGSRAFEIPFMASGNPLTFQLNDWHAYSLCASHKPGDSPERLVQLASISGVTLTTERVVVLTPGEPMGAGSQVVDIDLLGRGVVAANFTVSSRPEAKHTYLPVLEEDRLDRAIALPRQNKPDKIAKYAASLAHYLLGGWNSEARSHYLKQMINRYRPLVFDDADEQTLASLRDSHPELDGLTDQQLLSPKIDFSFVVGVYSGSITDSKTSLTESVSIPHKKVDWGSLIDLDEVEAVQPVELKNKQFSRKVRAKSLADQLRDHNITIKVVKPRRSHYLPDRFDDPDGKLQERIAHLVGLVDKPSYVRQLMKDVVVHFPEQTDWFKVRKELIEEEKDAEAMQRKLVLEKREERKKAKAEKKKKAMEDRSPKPMTDVPMRRLIKFRGYDLVANDSQPQRELDKNILREVLKHAVQWVAPVIYKVPGYKEMKDSGKITSFGRALLSLYLTADPERKKKYDDKILDDRMKTIMSMPLFPEDKRLQSLPILKSRPKTSTIDSVHRIIQSKMLDLLMKKGLFALSSQGRMYSGPQGSWTAQLLNKYR